MGDGSLRRRFSPPETVLTADLPERVCGACRQMLVVRRAVDPVERMKMLE